MAGDDRRLEEERLCRSVVVVAILALGLHNLLGRQVGVQGLLQGSGVRGDRDLEAGHRRSHIAGLLDNGSGSRNRRQIGGLGWVNPHHWRRRRQIGGLGRVNTHNRWRRRQIGGLGWIDLHHRRRRRQVRWLGGPHDRNLGLHGCGRQIDWRRLGHGLGRQIGGNRGNNARGDWLRRQIGGSRSGQIEGDARRVVVVARMIVVLMVFVVVVVAQQMRHISGGQSQAANCQDEEFLK